MVRYVNNRCQLYIYAQALSRRALLPLPCLTDIRLSFDYDASPFALLSVADWRWSPIHTVPYSVLLRLGTPVSGSFLLYSFERLDTRFALQHKNKSGSQKCTPLCGVPWIKSLRLIAEGFSISKTKLGQLMPKHQQCLIVQKAGKRH